MSSPDALHSATSAEWYTPPEVIEAARLVLGGIFLDPASSELANSVVDALTYYRERGLDQPWSGPIFLNPPTPPKLWWCRLVEAWKTGERAVYVAYSVEQLQQSQLWTPNTPMTAFPTCIPRRRLQYWRKEDGQLVRGKQPSHASAIVGLGVDVERFVEVFSLLGEVTPGRLHLAQGS